MHLFFRARGHGRGDCVEFLLGDDGHVFESNRPVAVHVEQGARNEGIVLLSRVEHTFLEVDAVAVSDVGNCLEVFVIILVDVAMVLDDIVCTKSKIVSKVASGKVDTRDGEMHIVRVVEGAWVGAPFEDGDGDYVFNVEVGDPNVGAFGVQDGQECDKVQEVATEGGR